MKYLYFLLFTFTLIIFQSCSKKLEHPEKKIPSMATVYTTAENTQLRITKTGEVQFKQLDQPKETQVCIFVSPDNTYQEFFGIGGAITDASAETYAKLPKPQQEELLNAYYDKKSGLAYNVIRTNMNSCDFSSDSYVYTKDGDKELKSFDIAHDLKFKIPMIKSAIDKVKDYNLFISPWSPPAYMKTNKDMLHGGSLLPEYNQAWADYYVKYIKALKSHDIDVWGLTIQNEPMATQIWESCIYTANEERDFLKKYLGPTMQKNGLQDKKIIVWDHNRDLIVQRANTILSDPEAAKYVWGIGFHWYENWSGGAMMYSNVGEVNKMYPDKKLFFTEGCADSYDANKIQDWTHGEKYASSMINDFNNGTVAWTDWNILLDEKGGPNHVGNFCFSPIHADLTKGTLIYTPSYFYIGHFSKFIKKGDVRVSAVSSRSQLLTTSFKSKDGKISTVVLNLTDQKVNYFLYVNQMAAEVEIPAHAIQTLVY